MGTQQEHSLDHGIQHHTSSRRLHARVPGLFVGCMVVLAEGFCDVTSSVCSCFELFGLCNSPVVSEIAVGSASAMSRAVIGASSTLASRSCVAWEACADTCCAIAQTLIRAFRFCFV